MSLALEAARQAAELGEVPVGAVLVHRHAPGERATLLASGHNHPIGLHDPTAHAEMLVLRAAASSLGNYRLEDCELYVTLEPCAMCAQAMLHARVRRVVFGTMEPKTGAAGSVLDLFSLPQLNHRTAVRGGVLAEPCSEVLQDFFQNRRQQIKRVAQPLRQDALRAPDARFAPVWSTFPDWVGQSHTTQTLDELDRLRLHWLDLGPADDAPPWLALHNHLGWWPQWVDWTRHKVMLGERVLIPDLIGFGQSDKPKKAQWHTLEKHARIVWEWLTSMGLSRVRLAVAPGQSKLASELKKQAPERVLEAVVVDPGELTSLPLDWADVPYLDDGHRSAVRAWVQNGWNQDGSAGQ